MSLQNLTPKREIPLWEPAFLKGLSLTGNVRCSCRFAKISRPTAYDHRRTCADFAVLWKEALDESMDILEREAWRRAVKGTKKPIYQGKEHVGTVVEYSDTLLIFLLKGGRPEKFRERSEVKHTGGLANRHTFDLSKVNDGDLDALETILGRATEMGGDSGGEGTPSLPPLHPPDVADHRTGDAAADDVVPDSFGRPS